MEARGSRKRRRPGPERTGPAAAREAPRVRLPWRWLLLLCGAGWLLAYGSARLKSVTFDEFQAVPHGLVILHTGRMDIDPGAAPLSKVLVSLPLLPDTPPPASAEVPPGGSSWPLGYPFAASHAADYQGLFVRARLVPLAAYVLTALLAGALAFRLHGRTAAVVAVLFTAFCPNMIAHGRLVTPDVFLAAAVLGALLAVDRLLGAPRRREGALLGLAVGLACLVKFTGLLLFVLLPLGVAGAQAARRGSTPGERPENGAVWRALGLGLVVAVAVINAGYLFQGTGDSVREYAFRSGLLRELAEPLPGSLPIPLPRWFVAGFDAQMAERGYVSYLMGRLSTTGFWNYYLVAFLVKTPLPVLLLAGAATLDRVRIGAREVPALAVAVGMLVVLSLAGHKNIGIRYLLFVFPILAVWISRLASDSVRHRLGAGQRRGLLSLGAAGMLVLHVFVWPDYLPYFNAAAAGPDEGHEYLLDSNLDWGQDLIQLRRYMEEEGIDTVDLAYAGRVRPEIYGIRYRTLGTRAPGRWVVVSANLLWGRTYFVNGSAYWPRDPNTYSALRNVEPVTVIGHTLYVFDLSGG